MYIDLLLKDVRAIVGSCADDSDGNTMRIQRIASLKSAQAHDLAVILERGDLSVFQQLSLEAINSSQAGFLLTQRQLPHLLNKQCIIVPDVLAALKQLVQSARRCDEQCSKATPVIGQGSTVHPSAVISPGAIVGNNCTIMANTFVGNDCVIGDNVILYPGVALLDRCTVGDDSIIHANVVIGSDGFGYHVGVTGLDKIPQIGIVAIGNNVEIGAGCMIDRASFDATVIGDGVKIDNGVHIAHNVTIGAHTAILAQTGIAGSTTIGAGCQIGGQVAIKDHVAIGNRVKIVSKSAVMRDVADDQVIAGIPAVPFSQWKRMVVAFQRRGKVN